MIRVKHPASDEAFSEYVRLLLRLHELIAAGKGDTDEADELRDEMDSQWRRLDAQRLALADGLSADLYTIGIDRESPDTEPDEADGKRFTDAVQREDWRLVLDLLREIESDLPPNQVAGERGYCWAYLSQPDVALVFLREKQRFEPFDVSEEVMRLTCLIQANRLDEAAARAREIAEDESEPALLLKAAEVLFVKASQSASAENDSLRQVAIDASRRGLELGEAESRDEVFESLRLGAHLHLALSYDALGQRDEAGRWCEKALRLNPSHFDALMLFGYLAYGEYPQSEKPAFRGDEHRRLVVAPKNLTQPLNTVNSK